MVKESLVDFILRLAERYHADAGCTNADDCVGCEAFSRAAEMESEH